MKRILTIIAILCFLKPAFAQDNFETTTSNKSYLNSLAYRYTIDNIGYNHLLRYGRKISKKHKYSLNIETGFGTYSFDEKDSIFLKNRSFILSPGIQFSTAEDTSIKKFVDWELAFQLTIASGHIFDWYSQEYKYRFGVAPNISAGCSINLKDYLFINLAFRQGIFIRNIQNPKDVYGFLGINKYINDNTNLYFQIGIGMGFRF